MSEKKDDDPKTKRVFRLEVMNADFGYTDQGQCIECLVNGEDLCSMHATGEKNEEEEGK